MNHCCAVDEGEGLGGFMVIHVLEVGCQSLQDTDRGAADDRNRQRESRCTRLEAARADWLNTADKSNASHFQQLCPPRDAKLADQTEELKSEAGCRMTEFGRAGHEITRLPSS